jgi:hypothetical protein
VAVVVSSAWEPLRNNLATYIYFVTAPYAAPGTEIAMLLFYNGLVSLAESASFYEGNFSLNKTKKRNPDKRNTGVPHCDGWTGRIFPGAALTDQVGEEGGNGREKHKRQKHQDLHAEKGKGCLEEGAHLNVWRADPPDIEPIRIETTPPAQSGDRRKTLSGSFQSSEQSITGGSLIFYQKRVNQKH